MFSAITCGNLKGVEMAEYVGSGRHWEEDLSIPYWGRDAFYSCSDLVEIDLSNYPICSFEEACFSGCSSLEKIILPQDTTELMPECFANCYNLRL